ncbi:MAG: hypothetical protein K6G54_08030, partial [Oscillospiraceae bacterium]|nr:hypothetical protein [Oscillospiraceae bacterium]
YLGSDDAAMMAGKRILIVDDVISTGGSLKAMEALVEKSGGTVAGRMAVLAEGAAAERKDILFLEKLPTFHADGSVRLTVGDTQRKRDACAGAQASFFWAESAVIAFFSRGCGAGRAAAACPRRAAAPRTAPATRAPARRRRSR